MGRGAFALGSFPGETDVPKKAEGMRGRRQQGEKRQSKMGRKGETEQKSSHKKQRKKKESQRDKKWLWRKIQHRQSGLHPRKKKGKWTTL